MRLEANMIDSIIEKMRQKRRNNKMGSYENLVEISGELRKKIQMLITCKKMKTQTIKEQTTKITHEEAKLELEGKDLFLITKQN